MTKKLMTASVSVSGERNTLRMERLFNHSVQKVWRAITEPQNLSAWWCMKIDVMKLELGALLDFYAEGGYRDAGRITELEVGRIIAFTSDGSGHSVRFELVEEGAACRILFTHEYPVGQPPAEPASGWHQCFDGLESQLDNKPITPLTMDADLASRYATVLH
jgi:uncharacterized protein YndB with AHSA1/START domain